MTEVLSNWVMLFISSLGYAGVFILMTLESACIPVPSEVTMPFSGSLTILGYFNFWTVVAVGTLGNLVGSLIAYWIGAWGQEAVVRKIIVKYGKYFLLSEHEYDQSERWFRKHGEIIVFASRILPVVRTFISLPAGISNMNIYRFTLYTTAGSFLWSYLLTKIGVVMGNNWSSIQSYFHKFDFFIVAIGALTVVLYVHHKLKRLRAGRLPKDGAEK